MLSKPVIPRHVRDQLLQSNVAATVERVEPSFNTAPIEAKAPVETAAAENIVKASETDVVIEPEPVVEFTSMQINKRQFLNRSLKTKLKRSQKKLRMKAETELSLNPNIATVEIEEFDGESNILDVHLHEQQRYDDESALATAEQIIALNVYPNPRRALSGDKALKVLLKYGLRFGEMSCFHRYENTDEPSPLMFSVLRVTDNGPAGFDLESLSGNKYKVWHFSLHCQIAKL
jgi:cell division protein ZipA